jgi:hypothetical protein
MSRNIIFLLMYHRYKLLHLTLIFFMSGFALSYAVNMFILMILYDFWLLPAPFYYIIIYVRMVESSVQIADQCALWKISSGAEKLVLRMLQF